MLLHLVAPAVSLGLVLLFGRPVIALLRKAGAGQRVRDDGPQRHLQKEGTPTMGGLLIVAAGLIGALVGGLVARLCGGQSVSLEPLPGAVIGVVLAFAAIGLLDDWLKVARGRSLGLKARQKLALEVIAAAFWFVMIWSTRAAPSRPSTVTSRELAAMLGLYGMVWTLALVGTSNAVNLADGLDGLAAGLCTIAFAAMAAIALAGPFGTAAAMPALSLAGACLGFLWFNRHPARVFMGDVGSLALGAALAALGGLWLGMWVLVGVCLVPFVEMLSVIIQVISFKTTGKRVFRMSPIHHHFELIGWSERRVVYTFWAVGAAAAAVTVWWCLR